jgi:hypothetical protein
MVDYVVISYPFAFRWIVLQTVYESAGSRGNEPCSQVTWPSQSLPLSAKKHLFACVYNSRTCIRSSIRRFLSSISMCVLFDICFLPLQTKLFCWRFNRPLINLNIACIIVYSCFSHCWICKFQGTNWLRIWLERDVCIRVKASIL